MNESSNRSWAELLTAGREPVRVLVVDDEPAIRALVRATLQRDQSFQLVLAEDGERALEAAARWKPAVIVLDVRMPKLDGFEVCERLRADPAFATCKVVMLTALGQNDDIERGYAAGADDYLLKPFEPNELSAKVRGYLPRAA